MKMIKQYIYWIPVIFWMGLIFYLSHQPAEESSELSFSFSEILINILTVILPVQEEMNLVHFLIRKAAHFCAYFVLGLLVMYALRKIIEIRWKSTGLALFICVLYAISDELHQLFIPGRSGEIRYVIIDSLGAVTGLIVYIIFVRMLRK